MKWERYLRNLYRNLKKGGSYQSADKLFHTVQKEGKFNLSRHQIQKFLSSEDTHTLNKEVRGKFRTNNIEVTPTVQIFEFDLADLSKYTSHNDGFRYLCGGIESFSRKLFVRPLKTKSGREIVAALQDIFTKTSEKPRTIRSDRGSEFTNATVSAFLKEQQIGQTFTSNLSQAAFIERCWKSIKKRMTKYMQDKRTLRYIDVLDDLVEGYNNTYHTAIGMTPNEAYSSTNKMKVEYNQLLERSRRMKKKKTKSPVEENRNIAMKEESNNGDDHGGDGGGDGGGEVGGRGNEKHGGAVGGAGDATTTGGSHDNETNRPQTKSLNLVQIPKKISYKFPIGASVRISKRPEKLSNEYREKWMKEIFYIHSRRLRDGIPVYKLKDAKDEVLFGSFYTAELQHVGEPKASKLYDIKEVLKERTVKDAKGKKKREFFVSFVGFPRKFNQWIPEQDIREFPH